MTTTTTHTKKKKRRTTPASGSSRHPTKARKARGSHSRNSQKGKWSASVTKRSDAMDLVPDVFKKPAAAMARSVKRSAARSTRRKSQPFRSAMSMLTFFANRAGKNLSLSRRKAVHQAKVDLRRLFGR